MKQEGPGGEASLEAKREREPETGWRSEQSCHSRRILRSLCQLAQMFLFLQMMKIRDLNSGKKLERHCLSSLGWWGCNGHFVWTTYTEEQGKY